VPRQVPVLDLLLPPDPEDLADAISTALHDLEPAAVHELEDHGVPLWRVFFRSQDGRAAAQAMLSQQFAARGLRVAPGEVEDDDWAARSQAALTHIRVGHVVVAPPWDVPPIASGDTLVIIKPSMGFGTGHHETTRLCLECIQRVDCRGLDVIDVGTGSGILGIAAAKRGARHVVAIDNDPDAIASARENVALNVEQQPDMSRRIRVILGTLEGPRPAAHIVLANLTAAALTQHADALVSQTSENGRLILSGFVDQETDAVVNAFANATRCEALTSEGQWRAVLLLRA
jgi:ribosomal protein L11 methyltransferase